MDPVCSWVDVSEVSRLARLLLVPVVKPSTVSGDAGFGEQFVGYALGQGGVSEVFTPVESPVAPALAEARHNVPDPVIEQAVYESVAEEPVEVPEAHGRTEEPADEVTHTPTSEPQPQEAPQPQETPAETGGRGPFLDRFGRFREWLRAHFACSGLFLLDRNGSVISDDTGYARLHVAARNLAHAARQPGAVAQHVHMKLGVSLTMEVLPVDTPYGCLVLGVLVPQPLVPEAVTAVIQAMRVVARPPEHVGNGNTSNS